MDHLALPRKLTARLDLRPLVPADVPHLFAIQRDSARMRFTHIANDLESYRDRLVAFERTRSDRGFAPWVVRDGGAAIVGWGGLCIDPADPGWGVEVIYFLAGNATGKGYATELVSAALVEAAALGIAAVGAFVMPENSASARVLERCGFRRVGYEPKLERDRYRANIAMSRSQF